MNDRKLTFREAINEALKTGDAPGSECDPSRGGRGRRGQYPSPRGKNDEAYGGPLGVTKGLMTEFGRKRVIDTPISESAIMGSAVGLVLTGLRPVAELMFIDFLGVCLDQISNQGGKFRYMFGGKTLGAHGGAYDHRGGNGCRCTTFRRVLFCLHPLCGPESGCSRHPLRCKRPSHLGDLLILTPLSSVSKDALRGGGALPGKGNTLFPWVWPM